MLEKLIYSEGIASFCKKIKHYQFNTGAKVCGLDVGENFLNFKIYIELPSIPDFNTLCSFLPSNEASDFLQYANHWDKSRESSLALGFKIDSNNIAKNYYHIKFTPEYSDDNFNVNFEFLNILKIDINKLKKGISAEIPTSDTSYKKHYVYAHNPMHIEKILAFKNIKCKLEQVEELEMYTSYNNFKINIVNFDDGFKVKQDVLSVIPNQYHDIIISCSKHLDSEPMYSGVTKNKIYSVYFSLTNKQNNIFAI